MVNGVDIGREPGMIELGHETLLRIAWRIHKML